MDEERIAVNDFAWTRGAANSGGLVERRDVGLDIAKSAGSGNGADMQTDLDLPKGLYRFAISIFKIASLGLEKVTVVAQNLTMVSEIATSSAPESMGHVKFWP